MHHSHDAVHSTVAIAGAAAVAVAEESDTSPAAN